MEKTISEIQKEIKIFELMKANEMTIYDGKIYYELDNQKVYTLGIIINGYCISLERNYIFTMFESIEQPEIDNYYIFNVYDYGVMIPYEKGSFTLKEEPETMKKLYEDRLNWYNNEFLNKKKQKIISFEKEKKLRNK